MLLLFQALHEDDGMKDLFEDEKWNPVENPNPAGSDGLQASYSGNFIKSLDKSNKPTVIVRTKLNHRSPTTSDTVNKSKFWDKWPLPYNVQALYMRD